MFWPLVAGLVAILVAAATVLLVIRNSTNADDFTGNREIDPEP
jgi:hypothetical protein